MKRLFNYFTCGMLIATGMAFAGCETTYDDVADARQNVAEESRETEEARREGDENIRQQQRELDSARHTANRANYDEVQKEQKDVQEARKEKAENVREEQKETAEAKAKAERLERELAAKNARTLYIDKMNQQLEVVDKRINDMQERLDNLEGEAYDKLEAEIDTLQKKREQFADAIAAVDDVDVLVWETKKDEVERARQAIELDK